MSRASLEAHIKFTYDKVVFGFWSYLMSDCALFATLFVTYIVHHKNFFGGPTSKELFDMSSALQETLILLTSSFTSGLALFFAYRKKKIPVLLMIGATFALGTSFLSLEIKEFMEFFHKGADWQRSAFLSSFFTLVGTHGAHITVGLFWMIVLSAQLLVQGVNSDTFRRVTNFSLFWHFLDIVWVGIFTIVYLWGKA